MFIFIGRGRELLEANQEFFCFVLFTSHTLRTGSGGEGNAPLPFLGGSAGSCASVPRYSWNSEVSSVESELLLALSWRQSGLLGVLL